MDNDGQNVNQEPQVDWQLQYAAVNRTCTALANQNLELIKQRSLLEELNSKLDADNRRLADENKGLRSENRLGLQEQLGLEQDLKVAGEVEQDLYAQLDGVRNQISTLSSWAKEMIESIKDEGAAWLLEDEYGNDQEGLEVVQGIIEQWTDSEDDVVAVQLLGDGDGES